MEQDFTKISSNPIACIKIDSPNSIHDFSGKGLKKNAKRKRKTFFLPSFSCYLICCPDSIQKMGMEHGSAAEGLIYRAGDCGRRGESKGQADCTVEFWGQKLDLGYRDEYCARDLGLSSILQMEAGVAVKDENGTEIFRTDRFRFLYYDIVFYIMIPFPNFTKHKNLSFSIDFTTIFNYFFVLFNC
jgi:hypothetical protein